MLPKCMEVKYSVLQNEKSNVQVSNKKGEFLVDCDDLDSVFNGNSFDTKIRHYKSGFRKVTYCNNKIFHVEIQKRHTISQLCVDEQERVREHKRKRNDVLHRAKERIYDFILLNEFEWFLTITLSKEKIERDNVFVVIKKLQDWLKNQVKRKGLKYILIPEYHKKDNSIHCHALISGNLNFVDSGTRIVRGYKKPLKLETIKRKHIAETDILHEVYNVIDWKYGWSTAIKCYGDVLRRANYIVKYVTKDLEKIFGRYYWHSQNLVSQPEIEYTNIEDYRFRGLDLPEYGHRLSDNKFKYETNILFTLGESENESKRLDERI